MRISISIELITAQILAYTALRHHNSGGKSTLLTTDRAEAIRQLAVSAFGIMCIKLSNILTDCNIDAITADDSTGQHHDILWMELADSVRTNPAALRLLVERGMFTKILADMLAETDHQASMQFEAEFSALTDRLRHAASGAGGGRLISRYPY